MTPNDRNKISELTQIFERNFRLTHLYSEYISRYPEIISEELISGMCNGTDISKKDAIVALLSEIFNLDRKNSEDRKLIYGYIEPSVTLLKKEKYTDNPYIKRIAPKEAKLGDWEIKWEYYPPYRVAICGDMVTNFDFSEYPPIGFFEEGFSFPAVLEGGNEWMTLTPVDTDTCEEAISEAFGKVVTFGLGLGYYTYMVSNKACVDSITVVERSADVIRLFKEHILPSFEHPEKVRIINADAFEYAEKSMPREKYTYAFADTWRDASDGLPMYERMKALEHLSPETKFSYWIENFILSRKRALRFEEMLEKLGCEAADAPGSYDEFIKGLTE